MADTPPVPDPTILTTEQLLREVDNASKLLRAEIAKVDSQCQERFSAVNSQFTLVETQRVEQKKDTKDAVDAALTAQKEAVREQTKASGEAIDKSERATKEQLSQLSNTFKSDIGGLTTTLLDLKERVGRIESVRQGAAETRTEGRANVTTTTAIIAAIAAALLLLLGYRASQHAPAVVVPTQTVTVTNPGG